MTLGAIKNIYFNPLGDIVLENMFVRIWIIE